MDRASVLLFRTSAALPGAEVWSRTDLLIGSLKVPIWPLNTVTAARLTPRNVEGRIDEALGWFAVRGMPVGWWIGPRDTPPDLGQRLARRGLATDDEEILGMAMSLSKIPSEVQPVGITVERVTDAATLTVAADIVGRSFGAPPELANAMGRFAALGFADSNPMRSFLARLDGHPVGTALALRSGQDAGIFNVGTLEHARRRGVGRAITLAALADAKAAGCSHAVLQSSPAGHPVYESLGFRDFGRYRVYIAEPSALK
jgi:ribosomal protein S18 acetylase RimI-like enzyme